MDSFAKTVGMHLRKVDFESHVGEWVTPLTTNYRGIQVYELPPNGQVIFISLISFIFSLFSFFLKKNNNFFNF